MEHPDASSATIGLCIASMAFAVAIITGTEPGDEALLVPALCAVAFHAGIALLIHAVAARRLP